MNVLLETENLKKYFSITGGVFRRKVGEVKAVDNVSLKILKGECFGLVGESGCGKTTFGKTVIRLLKPTAGNIYLDIPIEEQEEVLSEASSKDSKELTKLRHKYNIATFKGRKLKSLRRKMQIVYQDPTRSLNPRMLIKDTVSEPLLVQKLAKGAQRRQRTIEMLSKVGLTERHLYRYPHEFSGGQRQRIAIARALVTNPEFVVLDEPTSSVDVSVRAQLLNLFQDLQKEMGLTYLFVSHDLSVIECISHRVGVMYLGKVVEQAPTAEIFAKPLHPYTVALFSSIPIPDPTLKRERVILKGEVPSPVNPPRGCRFHPRCNKAGEICSREEPQFVDVGNGHLIACHLFQK
jgi:oligopeptide/dipeptide ABC transporter ATP-binding protein